MIANLMLSPKIISDCPGKQFLGRVEGNHDLAIAISRGREYWVKKRSYLQNHVGTPSNQSIISTDLKIENNYEIGQKLICWRHIEVTTVEKSPKMLNFEGLRCNYDQLVVK